MPGDARRSRMLRLGKAKAEVRIWEFLELWIYSQRIKVRFFPLVQDQRPDADRTEFGPRPVRSIFWDRRSRFGLVDQPSFGRWTSLSKCQDL